MESVEWFLTASNVSILLVNAVQVIAMWEWEWENITSDMIRDIFILNSTIGVSTIGEYCSGNSDV